MPAPCSTPATIVRLRIFPARSNLICARRVRLHRLAAEENEDVALDLERVRQEAREANLYEIYVNHTSRVVSFAPYDDVSSLTRLNVYWTTGTVGTCLDHPRQGKTQLFRRNVSLMLLRELMRDPRLHTGTGYHRRAPQRETCSVCLDKTAHVLLVCGHNTLCAGCADHPEYRTVHPE